MIHPIEDTVNSIAINSAFKKLATPCVIVRGKIIKVNALINQEEKIIILQKDYTLKKNDKIISEKDICYFVIDTDTRAKMPLKYSLPIIGEREIELECIKIDFDEKPFPIPSYISQSQNISTNINISGSSITGSDFNISASQNINFSQMLLDLENCVENCYNIEELRPMIKELQISIGKKEKIEESKISKFFKFMGTQLVSLTKALLVAYATAKMSGVL